MHTDCPSKVWIKFANADKGSKKRPCCNVSVICRLCPLLLRAKEMDWQPAVWRYNMEQHFNLAHPEYAHPGKLSSLPLPSNITPSIIVDSRKEAKFGVPFHPQFTHIQIVREDEAVPTHEKRRTANANDTAVGSSLVSKRPHTK